MIPPEFQWKTNDGRVLDIRWMDSVHLVNSFNMLCRKHGLSKDITYAAVMEGTTLPNMTNELKARGFYNWGINGQANQLIIPRHREKVQALCMFRAMMDHGMTDAAELFLYGDVPLEHYLSESDRLDMKEVIASYAAYRLERP